MKFAVGVVTYNPESTLRFDLLEQTVDSVRQAFPDEELLLLDNGSDDGSTATVRQQFGKTATVLSRHNATNTTPGAGRNCLLPSLIDTGADVVVMSDDDMLWRPDARDRLRAFWTPLMGDSGPLVEIGHRGAPELTTTPTTAQFAILGGLLEDELPWNTPRQTFCPGLHKTGHGINCVIRDSVPGAAWTMLSQHARQLPGYPEPFVSDFGYDHRHCLRLSEMCMLVGAADLATHEGWGASTHGNRTDLDIRAKPLDRKRWGV